MVKSDNGGLTMGDIVAAVKSATKEHEAAPKETQRIESLLKELLDQVEANADSEVSKEFRLFLQAAFEGYETSRIENEAFGKLIGIDKRTLLDKWLAKKVENEPPFLKNELDQKREAITSLLRENLLLKLFFIGAAYPADEALGNLYGKHRRDIEQAPTLENLFGMLPLIEAMFEPLAKRIKNNSTPAQARAIILSTDETENGVAARPTALRGLGKQDSEKIRMTFQSASFAKEWGVFWQQQERRPG